MDWLDSISVDKVISTVQCVVIIVVGLPALMILSRVVSRLVEKHYTPQSAMVARQAIFYSGLIFLAIIELHQMGFKITALLGAAGVAGVAIGFAAQTSLSNLISGIFLIFEKPFAVGDTITVGETSGTVLSIDLLSVKLRQYDNKFVRIPNESLIKGQVTNITRFPIRRYDINLGVAYKEDIKRVTEVLKDIADKNPYCLDEPEPLVVFTGFGDSCIQLLFAVWFLKADFLQLRNSIMLDIKERFDAEGIEIPFPHRTLYSGSVTAPFPITIVNSNGVGHTSPSLATRCR